MTFFYYFFFFEKWAPEIRQQSAKAQYFIVGTKIDLRDDEDTVKTLLEMNQKPITKELGIKMAREVKAVKYLECSALTQVVIILIILFNFYLIYFKIFRKALKSSLIKL